MKKRFLLKALFTALFTLLLTMVGKVNAQTYSFNPIKAETVGIIPYSDDFTTYDEVVERNYAITSFKMLDTATVAVLTGASDMILVYSLEQNQILYKIQLPTAARAFDYDNGLFHVIGDRTYLSIDQYGVVHERKDFQQPQLPNEEAFIISDLKVIDGQPVIHESDSRTYGITSGGLQEIDPYYYHHAKDCKIHPQYVDENRFTLFNETPSRKGSINVTMNSLGLEGKLSCIDYVSVDDDCIGIHLETTHNCTGGFVKSYLLALNSNGDLITLVEVPINFLAYIHKPFQFKDGAFYYAFAGQKGVSLFKIDTNTNTLDSPDPSFLVPDDTYTEPETPRDNTSNNDRGNWRTITQTWYNGYNGFISLNWTPISSNVAPSCTWVSGGYIRTPITSYGYTETGVPYKWGGWTDWTSFESLASQGKYTGNKVTTTSCGGAAYSSSSDGLVLGDDCSGFVSRCLEHSTKLSTSTMSSVCSDHGLVTSASSSDFQKGDALNKSGNHVMLYTGHNGSNQINVFECSATDWKTSARTYNTSYFTGYRILRYNYMKNIILRLASAITLKQNGSTVTTVTQGVPLTVTYSVKNFGTETWTGIVSLWIEQSNGTLICIQGESQNGVTTLSPGQSASFVFQNNGVSSPQGTTRLFVKVLNYNAGGYDRHYDVGEGNYTNPKIFNIVEAPTTNYTITASANPSNGGTVSGGGSYSYGSNCTLTATANSGYNFVRWKKNGSQVSTNASYSFTVTENATYVAEFSQNSYTITASANPSNGGTVSGGGSYSYGSSCTLTATANSGYNFVRWKKNGSQVSTNASYSFTVIENATYVAEFSQNSYTITASANPSNGGTVSGGGTYAQGSTATVTATASSGYTFTNWTENGSVVSTSPTYSFTVNGNRTLVAHFSQNSYTVSTSANPTAGGTVSGGGTYAQGSNATVTATANSGYSFTNWTESGSVVSSNGTYTFQVNGNRTLVANFEAQGGQITNHYLPVSQGSSGSMVITGVIQINGIEQASDQLELGVFCGNECRGSSIAHPFTLVQPNYYMVDPVVYGDAGDSFTFKLYDHSSGQELNYTSPEALAFNENGYGNAFTPYVLNFESTISQSQSLASGWNWWSTYVETGGAEGLGMLENSLGDACIRIQSRNQYVDNYGTFWYGTLTEINNEESYRIRTNQSCTATLVGMEASPSNHPISVNPGWNWVGFPCAEYVSLSTAMDNFNPEVNDQLKSRHQYCSYIGNNQWYGTLQTLEPGQGYMYKSNASGTKTLVYQAGREESLMANVTTEKNFFTPECEDYADNMTLTAVVEVEGAELRSEDYEVAAFVGDQCRGSVKLMYVEPIDRYVAFLLAYGEAEEGMHFVLTDGTEAVLSSDVIRFAADGTVGTVTDPVVLHFGTWGMNDKPQAVVNVFPNPSKDIFNVEGSGIRKVEVVDAWGQVVLAKETKDNLMQLDLSGKAAGVYVLRVLTENGVTTHKLIKEK